MTSAEENQTLTRTGPGTPMGELFRRYWLPALPAHALAAPHPPPAGARAAAGREADRVSRHAGTPRADGRVLRAPRRVPLVRAQRGRGAALLVSRLEI